MSKDVNQTTPSVDKSETNVNSVQAQGGGEGELRERLAAIEHERWADWQKWMHTKGTWRQITDIHGNPPASVLSFPAGYITHPERQINTPYAELSESEQASDMEQVDRYWPLIEAEIASRLRAQLTIAGKKVEFSHTAVNGDMHLFIDGYHNPVVCPECIQPGLLVEDV